MAIITVSRELGSLGTSIAEAVAAKLNTNCVDKEVLAEMARQVGISMEEIAAEEERLLARPVVVSEEMRSLFAAHRQGQGTLDDATYVQQLSAAIRTLAASGNLVFVGRGAQLILAALAGALHVHIYAPAEVRAARIQQRRNLPALAAATAIIGRADKQRHDWFRRFFTGANWKDPRHYHLMINTARIPAPLAVEMIVRAAQTSPDAS